MISDTVSVVVPAYNCSGTIKSSVDSVLAQSIPTKVIVVDDCSSDNTLEVLSCYTGDPRVNIVRNESNLGVAASRNKGVAMAESKYVVY